MQQEQEGLIKFSWQKTGKELNVPAAAADILLGIRRQMLDLNAMGMGPDGIGYGNASLRTGPHSFLITGSQTHAAPHSTPDLLCHVTDWDTATHSLVCEGYAKPSSEAMTHAAVYSCCPSAVCVLHGHHNHLWASKLNILPTTPPYAQYGTPDMAAAFAELIENQPDMRDEGTILMAGHQGGYVVYAATMQVALRLLRQFLQQE